MKCRHCNSELKHVFADLAFSPISNDMLKAEQLNEGEDYYPLKVYVCDKCFLVQLDEFKKADRIFNEDYTYFSSFSKSWLKHAEIYVNNMINRFNYNEKSLIIEIASNDGYLLQYFAEKNIPVLGIEPTANTALEAEKKGVKTIVDFFSTEFAKAQIVNRYKTADLIIGNNVLAHVPDINDFVGGMKLALNETGIITMEFPHLLNLVDQCQFDTIYHEHFSYLSLTAVNSIFSSKGLMIFDVDQIPTHGGSLRIYAKHQQNDSLAITDNFRKLLEKEEKAGIKNISYYENFQDRINNIKYYFLSFLIDSKRNNKKVIGYGAAAKGNTLINYSGIKGTDLIQFVVDASPYKQHKFLPGSHIPVVDETEIKKYKPDYVVILPWNLKGEISEQLSYIREWGGKFVIFIPEKLIF